MNQPVDFNILSNIGIALFVILYVYSTTLYPGGSQANVGSIGFDWVHNYWCNLMNEKAINGQSNPARKIAIAANIILCISMMLFFVQYAKIYATNVFWRRLISWSGMLSMGFSIFIFSSLHDLITTASSLFGLVALIGVILEFYKSIDKRFAGNLTLWMGIVALIFLAANNFIYYSGLFIEQLPLLQKITFGLVLYWIFAMNLKMQKAISR